MGQSIILLCPERWDILSFEPTLECVARSRAAAVVRFERQLQVESKGSGSVLTLREIADRKMCIDDYFENDAPHDPLLHEAVAGMRFYSVGFSDLELARQFIYAFAKTVISTGQHAWVDTDYGWLVSAADVVKEIDRNPMWDWRSAMP
jgi:hypothetical protein